jgi:hypothetical protein
MRRNLYAIKKNTPVNLNTREKNLMTDMIGAAIAIFFIAGLIFPIALCIYMLLH